MRHFRFSSVLTRRYRRYHGQVSRVAIALVLLGSLAAWAQIQSVASSAGAAPYATERRFALLIGNANYTAAPLRNPVNDAVTINQELMDVGFSTNLVLDADAPRMEFAIENFLRNLRENDVALFYYSGHGMQIDGENYLLPVTFNAATEIDVKYSAYPVSRLIESLNLRRTRMNIIILDACRDNPFRLSRSIQQGWAPMTTGKGTYIAFATSPGRTASDGDDGNGLFTKHLLEALKQPGLGLDDVFMGVRQAVSAESQGQQVPWSSSSVVGQFVFRQVQFPTVAVQPPGTTEVSSVLTRSLAGANAIIAASPQNPTAFKVRGATYARLHDYTRAIQDFSQAILLAPDYADAHRERGRLHLLLRDYPAAIVDFTDTLKLNPSDIVALHYRSLAYEASQQYQLAVQDATAIIQQAPTAIAAYLSRANAYIGLALYADAVADCTKAINANPNLAIAYAIRGAALRARGEQDAAKSDFARAAAIETNADQRQHREIK